MIYLLITIFFIKFFPDIARLIIQKSFFFKEKRIIFLYKLGGVAVFIICVITGSLRAFVYSHFLNIIDSI